jgi:hypothetical protein
LFFIFLCVLGSRLLSCTFRGASHIKASASKTFFCRGRLSSRLYIILS